MDYIFGLIAAIIAGITILILTPVYIRYAQDNPKKLWFKRKLYGWGWTPVTWQGWAVTLFYVVLIVLFARTIDNNSPIREVFFTGILPITLLTIAFIRIAIKKGEIPSWQWGDHKDQ